MPRRVEAFNSLFEMQLMGPDYEAIAQWYTFNSLFEMLGLLGDCFCGFLSFLLVVWGFVAWFSCLGSGCIFARVWGGVFPVLLFCVNLCIGGGMRRRSARRFISWIPALHGQHSGRIERFCRCKAHVARRFINAAV